MNYLKNLFLYYLLIGIPLSTMLILANTGHIQSTIFGIGMLFYAVIYHPFISGMRLMAGQKIKRNQFLLNFIPLWNSKWFNYLFFNVGASH